jgi:hypothetical protein
MIFLLFAIAAAYDGLLGLVGLFGTEWFFRTVGVTPPNHPGYVQFPAALLVVFAIMFVAVARDPAKNRGLIPYGMLLKVSYSGVVIYHWVTAGLPWVWKPFAVVDDVFLLLFAWAYVRLRSPAK